MGKMGWGAAAAAVLGWTLAVSPAAAQSVKNVGPMVEAFGKTCVPPPIDMATFGRELWKARDLILVDILVADGPGKSVLGLVFDTDMERFKATFPEFAAPARLTPQPGWVAERTVDATRFRQGRMDGSEIARPMLLCSARKE